jgi:hypothetical protein
MEQFTLQDHPTSYESLRDVGDVLIGDDTAYPLIEASSSGNDTALQSLLSQPQWVKTILEKPYRIYAEMIPAGDSGDMRRVMARPTSNIEWAVEVAAQDG